MEIDEETLNQDYGDIVDKIDGISWDSDTLRISLFSIPATLQAFETMTDFSPISLISEVQADKPLHVGFSYACNHYLIEQMNSWGHQDNYAMKYGTALAVTSIGGWQLKEVDWDGNPDPYDMVANYVGMAAAIYEDFTDRDFSKELAGEVKSEFGSDRYIDEEVSEALDFLYRESSDPVSDD